jgi:tetratricopeptide (TPR) repeat protein
MTAHFRTLFLCLAGFLVGRIFVFPGFLDPATPSHEDLYRYYLISQSQWEVAMWLKPRPLMLAFLHLVGGVFPEINALWMVLSITSVLFVTSLIVLLRYTKMVEPSNGSIFLFSLLVFSLPSSWEIYQLDYGGMLSGIIGVAAIYARFKYKDNSLTLSTGLPLALFWLAIETKPTFGAVILFLSLLDAYFKRNKSSIFLVSGIIAISVLVIVKDKLLGSPFVHFDESGGIYSVQFGHSQNITALLAYISSALPVFILPGLGLGYYLWWRRQRDLKSIALFPILAVMAILPMVLIPNRILTFYSWYSSVFFLMPVLGIFVNKSSDVQATSKFAALLTVCLIAIALIIGGIKNKPLAIYDRNLSKFNNNVLDDLNVIKANSLNWTNKKVLIAGMQGPYHPFKNSAFIQMQTHLPNYILLQRNSEVEWNKAETNLYSATYLSNIDYSIYDIYVVFDSNGKLNKILSAENIMKIPKWWQSAVVFCASDPDVKHITYQDYENVLACFNYAGEGAEVKQLIKANQYNFQLGPLGYFYLGNAYKSLKEPILAKESYTKALSFGENIWFREALNSITTE